MLEDYLSDACQDSFIYFVGFRDGTGVYIEHAEKLANGWVRLYLEPFFEAVEGPRRPAWIAGAARGVDVREDFILAVAKSPHWS